MTRKPGPRRAKKLSFSFTLVLEGVAELTAEIEDSLYEAGLDDALVGVSNGIPFADFDREAESLPEAVRSAMRDIADSATGLYVVRIEPDDLVNAAEIARRVGRSRESIRLLVRGDRGTGGFPAPVSSLRGPSPLYSWADVAGWFAANGIDAAIGPAEAVAARFVRDTNVDLSLDLRARTPGD